MSTLQAGPHIHSLVIEYHLTKPHVQIDPFDRPIDIIMPHPTPREQQQKQPASQSDNTPLASLQKQITQRMEMMGSMCIRLKALEARSRPIQPAAQSALPTLSAQQSTQQVTQLATQSDILQEEEQEEELQQANAENTAEKASDNKATISKNTAQFSTIPRHMLSTVPRQITTQQAENDTTIWPAISASLGNITLWYITAMTTQEEDLLRRSQPIGPLQEDIGRCIFGRIETV